MTDPLYVYSIDVQYIQKVGHNKSYSNGFQLCIIMRCLSVNNNDNSVFMNNS